MFARALTFLLALGFIASSAHAQDEEIDLALARTREQVLYAQYPSAIAAAESLLARRTLSAQQRNAALEVLATAQLADQQLVAARETLLQLFARDPDHRLADPDASPPVISAFARARESRPAVIDVRLRHDAPTAWSGREPPTVTVTAEHGADAIHELRLSYRGAGDPGFSQIVLNPRGSTWTGRIPLTATRARASEVVFYVLAFAPSGARLGQRGSETDPLHMRVEADVPSAAEAARAGVTASEGNQADLAPARSRSLTDEPAFWTVLALVVAGGVAAAVAIPLTTQGQGPDQGSLGSVTLMH
jgi:hypothetical protein